MATYVKTLQNKNGDIIAPRTTVSAVYLEDMETTIEDAIDTKAPINNPTFTGTVSGITKSMVGLGNVDNTSDANKPISTATQTALDLKAPKLNPILSGTIYADYLMISGRRIEENVTNGNADIAVNALGYNDTGTQFRDFNILNGKAEMIASFKGSDKSLTLQGNLIMPNGKGIDFSASQGSGATSSLLDDYEEGTWTPTTSTPNLTISISNKSYTKIGNMVFAKCYIVIENTSGSIINTYQISGLPFISDGYGFATNYFQGSQKSWYIETGGNFVNFPQDLTVGSNFRMYQFVYNTY